MKRGVEKKGGPKLVIRPMQILEHGICRLRDLQKSRARVCTLLHRMRPYRLPSLAHGKRMSRFQRFSREVH